MARIHNADPADPWMPVILRERNFDRWPDPGQTDTAEVVAMIGAHPDESMQAAPMTDLPE